MNINLIKNNTQLNETVMRRSSVLEISDRITENGLVYDLTLYSPEKNRTTVISPSVVKYDSIPVFNCVWNSPDIYYASVSNISGNELDVVVYRYNSDTGKTAIILNFKEEQTIIDKTKIIKLFILSESYILVQTEYKKDVKEQNQMGNITFTQTLYNLENGEATRVRDLNLINNGINLVIPIDEANIMFKTGFSSVEDDRINGDLESEALIESVYYGSLSMFISSLTRDNVPSGFKLLGTAYFNKSILKPHATDEYIYFTILDRLEMSEETIFYNYVTDVSIRCVNGDIDQHDLYRAYVIGNTPYIRTSLDDRTEFFNVKASETDCIFYEDEFTDVIGRLFILENKKNGHNSIRIYRYPKLDLISETRGTYNNGCCRNDDYYIYFKD